MKRMLNKILRDKYRRWVLLFIYSAVITPGYGYEVVLNIKRRHILTFALLLIISTAYAITPALHTEYSDGWRMSIDDNRLYLFAPTHYAWQSWPDTIAVCDYQVVADNVIQVSSTLTSNLVEQSATFTDSYDDTLIDSVRLIFSLPAENNYSITVGMEGIGGLWGQQWLTYQTKWNDTTIVTLSKSDYRRWNYLFIEPCMLIDFFPIGGHFLLYPQRLVWLKNHDFLMDKQNVYYISIPMLNPNYFDQFQIQNEYMLIIGDTIRWRGMDFVRDTKY